jgi:hypothetical protein
MVGRTNKEFSEWTLIGWINSLLSNWMIEHVTKWIKTGMIE